MLYIQLHIAYDFVSIEEIMGLSHMNIISIFLGLELRNERLTALKRIEAQIYEKKLKESNNVETFYHEAIPMENSGALFHHKSSGKVENILEGSLDSIPSPSVKIQIMGRKVC